MKQRGVVRGWTVFFNTSVLFAASLFGIGSATAGGMETPVGFAVNETGAANLSIAIEVPPGTAGMAPSLSLGYSSQGGNGMLGMGWGLGGLSAIARCGRTKIQDNVTDTVNYNTNDKFCLDGQRLVPVTPATAAPPTGCTSSTEYRTERESFTRVFSCGIAGSGPAYFVAQTKAGQIMEFGHTGDSAIEAAPWANTGASRFDIRVWAVNKISDTVGNYLKVTYFEDTPNGDYRPSRIDYTGNDSAGLAAYNSVRFVYPTANRPDITPLYQAGSVMKTMKLLSNVQTYAKVGTTDTMVKDYRLAYATSTATQRSRLNSVTECTGDGVACLPAVTVAWQDGGVALTSPDYNTGYALPATLSAGSFSGKNTSHSNPSYSKEGDFNGDGRLDYMWIPSNTTDGAWLIAYGTETGFTAPVQALPGVISIGAQNSNTSHSTPSYSMVGDFNGDGKTDYMWIVIDGSWFIAYGTETGFTTPVRALPTTIGSSGMSTSNPTSTYSHVGDFNGDGKSDYMWIPGNGDGRWMIAYGTGTGFTVSDYTNGYALATTIATKNTSHSSPSYSMVGDFNGDGKIDYMWIPSNGTDGAWLIAYGTGGDVFTPGVGAGFTTPVQALPGTIAGANSATVNTSNPTSTYSHVGDFNGDGKSDYMWIPGNGDGRWMIAYGTGAGFKVSDYTNGYALATTIATKNTSHATPLYSMVGDFNGDGKSDYMWIPSNGTDGSWLIAYGTGGDVFTPGVGAGFTPPVQALAGTIGGKNTSNSTSPYSMTGDFNGDGKVDYMWIPSNGDGRWLIAYSNSLGTKFDLLISITSGLGATTTLTYKPLTDSSVYTKDTGAYAAVSPYVYVDVQSPMYVVSTATVPNGIGGTLSTSYKYTGAKSHQKGGGFLGFRQFEVTDATGIKTLTTFRQDYPLQGLPATVTVTQAANQLKQITNTWADATYLDTFLPITGNGSKHNFPYLSQSVVSSWDLNGVAFPVVTTASAYDTTYGNATTVTVSTPDGYSKSTVNTYTNDLTNWYLGRLIKSVVTSTTP